MIELLTGFWLGRVAAGKGNAGAAIAAMVVGPVLIVLAVLGIINAADWYESSAQAQYSYGNWYAYPWNWPGVHLTESGWTWLQSHSPLFEMFARSANGTFQGAAEIAMWPLLLMSLCMRIGTAVLINVTVAVLPLLVVGRLWQLTRWVRSLDALRA